MGWSSKYSENRGSGATWQLTTKHMENQSVKAKFQFQVGTFHETNIAVAPENRPKRAPKST